MAINLGYWILHILAEMELVRVKDYEYYLCIIPIQINIGLMFGTKFQMRMEKKLAAREAKVAATTTIDEKMPLIEEIVVEEEHVPTKGAVQL